MQQTSTLYQMLLAAGAPKEAQAVIYETAQMAHVYGDQKLVSATTRAAMLGAGLAIGNCIAKELHLVILDPVIIGFVPVTDAAYPPERYPQYRYVNDTNGAWWVCNGEEWMRQPKVYDPTRDNPIPRMARIQMRYRLAGLPDIVGGRPSEWISKGTFFVDTRESSNGVLTIDAYDAMLKAEQPFTTSGDQGGWPRTDNMAMVDEIASRIGVIVDPRTREIITKHYEIGYPGYGEGAYTCRDVLGFLGSAYAGNWIITDEDKLRLIRLGDIPSNTTNLLITETGDYILIGGDRILVSR